MAYVKPERVGPFPFPKSDPAKRKEDFSEVEQPYTKEEVMLEADRCLRCGNPVCIDACPVQMDVRGMCDAVARGDFSAAYHRIRETNSLLGVTARCCPQMQGLCEDACVMRWDGQPISIGMVQRYVSDWEQQEARQADPSAAGKTGKRVSVVGAGPAGLAAAELLVRYGHSVALYDELRAMGGTAWYGIPDYHLPKDVLEYEARRIEGQGVEVKTGVVVGKDLSLTELRSESDAVVIATGSKDVNELDTPGVDLKGVVDGYGFLETVYVDGVDSYLRSPRYELGGDVLVIGGGDSALDCARTARRLTKGRVTIVYRRTESEMRSDPFMIDEAKEEGVEFRFLANPARYNGPGGRVTSTTMSTMELGPPDSSGRRSPRVVPGKEYELASSTVLLAVGRGPNSFLQRVAGLKTGRKNSIAIDDHYRTSLEGVFAAGDVTTGETLVVKAMGHGREAAQRVHEFLTGVDDSGHVSLYERYYTRRTSEDYYQDMLSGREEAPPPP